GGVVAHHTQLVLGHALDILLRLLHPITPFVTEELWTTLTGAETLVTSAWPAPDRSWVDPAAEAAVTQVQRVITEVRRFRSDQGLKPGQRVPARLAGASAAVANHETAIRALTRLTEPEVDFVPTVKVAVGEVVVELDLSGTVDVAAERQRLTRDLTAARTTLGQASKKLDNEHFLAKAPQAEVTKIRDRRSAAEADIARLEAQLATLPEA
ncbi:MAG TPA: class I tRNA ligase family protein, partial [Jiangellaceae bacterium]|nr:class I tRNA ligase family protein [Jiangellaceae bacterium]